AFPPDSPLRTAWKPLIDELPKPGAVSRSFIQLTFGSLYLDDDLLPIRRFGCQPLVFLNMCDSAQVTPALSGGFVPFFLGRGAVGVLGTECPMPVVFAHPFSEVILRSVLSGGAVGPALLKARQHFVQLGNPLGLAYTHYGPATARFCPPGVAPTDTADP